LAKEKQKALGKLSEEVLELEHQLGELRGVTLHNDFPIQVVEPSDTSIEVFAACDDTSRYAYISRDSGDNETPERWRATAYKAEGQSDGTPIIEGASRNAALRAGKDYVASGKLAKNQAPKAAKPAGKVGRPRKTQV
jgi:hypothetical protein